jgi:hypothetical protein
MKFVESRQGAQENLKDIKVRLGVVRNNPAYAAEASTRLLTASSLISSASPSNGKGQ